MALRLSACCCSTDLSSQHLPQVAHNLVRKASLKQHAPALSLGPGLTKQQSATLVLWQKSFSWLLAYGRKEVKNTNPRELNKLQNCHGLILPFPPFSTLNGHAKDRTILEHAAVNSYLSTLWDKDLNLAYLSFSFWYLIFLLLTAVLSLQLNQQKYTKLSATQ